MLKIILSMRNNHKIKCVLMLAVLIFCSLFAAGQVPSIDSLTSPELQSASITDETLTSPVVSRKFYELAYDLANSDNATFIENEQAITFLTAAMNLDNNSSDVRSLLLKCACRFPEQHSLQKIADGRNYFDLVYGLLKQYVDGNADVSLASDAADYLVSQAGSSIQKKTLLEQMIDAFSEKNPAFSSILAEKMGVFMLQGNSPEEAAKYFRQAYQFDKYNKFAFGKLVELTPDKIKPAEYLERLRLDLRENPLDMQTVLAFCQSCEQMQLYDTAADAYEYCSKLYSYLYPNTPLPANISIPWSISCYNSKNRQLRCMQIAETIKKAGFFDLRLESLSGRAAAKLGEEQAATNILSDAEKKALELMDAHSPDITATQLAWFYNFVVPTPSKAIAWSNNAYSSEPNSPMAASLLAYALIQNRDFNSAMPLISHFGHNQISDMALAQIQLEEGQGVQGIESLKRSISSDPGSFVAERAKEILAGNNEKYAPAVSPDSIMASFKNTFDGKIIPDFASPAQLLSASLNVRDELLSYGGNLDCAVVITNNSSEPLVINDESMFKGNINVDVAVTGDMSRKISNLVSQKIRTCEVIEPGKSIYIKLRLITGKLRDMLMMYPQASLNLTFTLHLDPGKSIEDSAADELRDIKPVSVTVKRPGIGITDQSLKNLVDSISASREGQKILLSQLFIGLLKEHNAFSGRTPTYNIVSNDNMIAMLKSAIINNAGLMENPANGGWVIKANTMAEMLNLPLDYEFINAIAKSMYNEKWPVRLIAVYLLAENQDKNFDKVLESIAKTDRNQLVKDIAAIELQNQIRVRTIRQ